MPAVNYKYSRDLLDRINKLEIDGVALSEKFFSEEYNLWYFIQASLFSEIKRYSSSRVFSPPTSLSTKGFFLSLFILAYSFFSFLFFFLKRERVLFFSIDLANFEFRGDFRLRSLYRYLFDNKISFGEIFHTIPGLKTVRNLFLRQRPAIYLESIDFLYYLKNLFKSYQDARFGSETFSPHEKEFARYLAGKYTNFIPNVLFRIRVLNLVFSWLKPKLILSIDDARSYNELIVAAARQNIPFVAFQHGHYSKYHFGWLNQGFKGKAATPDFLCVWSEYWKKELLRLNSLFEEQSIIISGATLDVSTLKAKNPINAPKKDKKERFLILIPYETDAPKNEVIEYINRLKQCPGVNVVFKVRPDRDAANQAAEYQITPKGNIEIKKDLSDIIDDIDAVGGTYSTFLYDMVALEKPVFIFETSIDYGEGLIKNNLADLVSEDSICERVSEICKTSPDVLRSRKEKLIGKNPVNFQKFLRELTGKYKV